MLVVQLLPTLSYGDAVSNDAIALAQAIKNMGYKTIIYAENIGAHISKSIAKGYKQMPRLSKDDIVIYHLSIGSNLSYVFGKLPCKKIIIYHNITPSHFFDEYSSEALALSEAGLASARWLADKVDYCIADSEFNKHNLIEMGYKCPIDVLPVLIPFEDYNRKPDEKIVEKYNDGYTNILFTGRIAPNKCQHDIIKSFFFYQKYYNPKSRLILVGSLTGFENYQRRLERYSGLLGVKNLIFTGHIKFDQILAYYKVGDLFLCQSEHEGFCVPIVEAMYFGLPIVAYDSTAVGETMGKGGILMSEKDAIETAGVMDYIIRNEQIRKQISDNQKVRLKDFGYEVIQKRFRELIVKII